MSLRIMGTGRALPELVVTNDDLAGFMETDDAWIQGRTGIAQRRICTTESLTELGARAAQKALDQAGIKAEALDYIICPTLQGDMVTPSLACQIQGEIGALCPAVDINSACTGFIYGLDMAAAYLDSGRAEHILVVCAEAMSRLVDWQDRGTCVLFGDGAAAVVVTRGTQLKATFLSSQSQTDILYAKPDYGRHLWQEADSPLIPLKMQGSEVYKFAVASGTRDLLKVVEKAGLTTKEIDFFLVHQANSRILQGIRQRLKEPAEKFPSNISRYGNTSAVSIPLLLDELQEQGRLKPGMMLAMSAFGAGLTTAACVLQWEQGRC